MRTLIVFLLTWFVPISTLAQTVDYGVDAILWSSLTEKFIIPGSEIEEFNYRPAPLAFRLGTRFGESWSVEGRMMYAKLFADNSPEKRSLGRLYDMEASFGWHPVSTVRIYGGYTYSHFDRLLLLRNNEFNVVTTEKGPLVGISTTADEESQLIARAAFDLYPYLNVHDTFHPAANGFHRGNYGFKTEGALGWWVTPHIGLYGTGGYQKISTLEGESVAFGRHESIMKTLGFGMAVKF